MPPAETPSGETIKELEGTRINRGFIGSDAASWIEHLRMAARILKGQEDSSARRAQHHTRHDKRTSPSIG